MKWMARLRLMPLLVLVAALSFGVRFGEFVTGVSSAPGSANAQQAAAPLDEVLDQATDETVASDVEQNTNTAEPQTTEANPTAIPAMPAEGEGEKINWKDADDSDLEISPVRMELFEDLSSRRKALGDQERELAVREALLKAAEQELEQKYKELLSIRSEIQDLLVEQTEEEKSRVASLVKIYEGMKPKDAARIFNTLDMDVLLQVVGQMSERKSAPVIASMDPARARSLTIMLMEQKSLPKMSENMTE